MHASQAVGCGLYVCVCVPACLLYFSECVLVRVCVCLSLSICARVCVCVSLSVYARASVCLFVDRVWEHVVSLYNFHLPTPSQNKKP